MFSQNERFRDFLWSQSVGSKTGFVPQCMRGCAKGKNKIDWLSQVQRSSALARHPLTSFGLNNRCLANWINTYTRAMTAKEDEVLVSAKNGVTTLTMNRCNCYRQLIHIWLILIVFSTLAWWQAQDIELVDAVHDGGAVLEHEGGSLRQCH